MSEGIVQDSLSSKLSSAVNEVTAEIDHCNSEIQKWEVKKGELQGQLQQAVKELQGKFTPSNSSPSAKPKKVPGKRSDQSVRELILKFFESNKQAQVKEIKTFLTKQGKLTNPGSEIARLKEDGVIKKLERGVYTLVGSD
jgi:hypothetical protein